MIAIINDLIVIGIYVGYEILIEKSGIIINLRT
jgi:hypothetical protein